MSSSWIREANYVEKQFLEQLTAQGWKTLVIADKENKLRTQNALLGRSSFKEVLLKERLFSAIKKINGSWLRDEQIDEVIATLATNKQIG